MDAWLDEVPNITIPVTAEAFKRLKDSIRQNPNGPADTFLIQVGDQPGRGRWTVVATRSQNFLGDAPAHWVTLEWSDDPWPAR